MEENNYDEQLTFSINLQDVLSYINSEDFSNYIFNTTSTEMGIFIIALLNQTIKYMLTDENINKIGEEKNG